MTTPEHPRVDVVIATHHRPEQLRVAIDAVLGQDHTGPINVIVVFDQSEPDLGLEKLGGDGRSVEVITNTRTPGLAGARNSGILHGSAPLVAFCDDDDIWEPSKLRLQVESLQTRPDALTCVTGITILYEDREVPRVPTPATVELRNLARNRGMEAHPSTVLVRRDALVGPIGLVDEEIPGSYGEDFDWILRAVQAGPICVVQEPLVRVVWGQSLFSQRWATIVEAIDYGLRKHSVLADDRFARARLLGRKSFGLAALGRRGEAVRCAVACLRSNWRERRAYLAVAVSTGLVSAEWLMAQAHRRGRGI